MKCTVCSHPQCRNIDLALFSAGNTLESLRRQYGPSKSALWRHRNHLKDKMVQARERLQRTQDQGCLLKLNAFLDHVQRGVLAAEAEGDLDKVFKGSHIGSRIIHQINKLDAPMELETVYRLISFPGFVSQDSILPTGPRIIADLHQALVDSAFFPCPEPPPEIVAADEDQDQDDTVNAAEEAADRESPAFPLETQNSNLETSFPKTENRKLETVTNPWPLAPDPRLSDRCSVIPESCLLETENRKLKTENAFLLLQQHFPDLDLSAADISSLSATRPKNQRDISATLPRQAALCPENIIQYHQDTQDEKNLAKNPPAGRESTAPPAILAGQAPPADAESPLLPDLLETWNSELETAFSETDTDPNPCLSNPSSLIPNPCPLPDATALRADELFEIAHGYKRHNPPKHIPNRRREEDFKSSSVFQDLKGTFF